MNTNLHFNSQDSIEKNLLDKDDKEKLNKDNKNNNEKKDNKDKNNNNEEKKNNDKNNDDNIYDLLKGKQDVTMDDDDLTYLDIIKRPSFDTTPIENKLKSHPLLSNPNKFNLYDDKKEYAFPKNIFNLLFHLWAKPILKISNSKRKKLQIFDLGEFHPDYYPDAFLEEIKTTWQEKLKKTKSNPLIKTLLSKNYKKLIFAFFISILVAILDSYSVILYEEIILHLDSNSEQKPKYKFLNTIILLLFIHFIYIIIFRAMETYTSIYSYKITVQIDVLIYDKLLKISPFSNCSEGALINFIQSDAESFGEFFTYTPTTLVLPFQISFYSYLLFCYFGKTFIFGIITLIFILIIFSFLQKLRTKYQKEMFIKKDKRMKTTTQIFEKIKIVKLYSWENYYLNRIKKEREEELNAFRKAQMVYLLIESITWSIGPILNFVSVFTYNLFNPPMELSKLLYSLYIFYSLTDPMFLIPEYISGLMDSLLSLKHLEAFLFSKEYNPSQLINTNNNNEYAIFIDNLDFGIIKKEEEFQDFEEDSDESDSEENINIKEENEKKIEMKEIDNKKEKEEILIENSNELLNKKLSNENKINNEQKNEEKISKKEKIKGTVIETLLTGINLKIKKGSIIGIVGEFGSGKTCLFNAILNNLDILNSNNKKIIINGSIVYIPQIPWIINETVRNNIIFPNNFNLEKYKKIVKICQLENDFELLKSSDFTKISDKGDNLSGGQKARINIARGVYNDADIYLFDDPFSALDVYVGNEIFNKVILEYLKGKTILIITHALQFIPMMDFVIHMEEGKIDYFGKAIDAENQTFFKNLISTVEQKKINEQFEKYKKEKLNNIKLENVNTVMEIESDDSTKIITKIQRKYSNISNYSSSEEAIPKYKKPNKYQGFKIVFSYSGGFIMFFIILLFCIFWKLTDSGSDFIITKWSSGNDIEK